MTTPSTHPPRRLADGSSSGKNFYSACFRALDSYLKLARSADAVLCELENATMPGHRTSLPADDSLVIALKDFPDDD